MVLNNAEDRPRWASVSWGRVAGEERAPRRLTVILFNVWLSDRFIVFWLINKVFKLHTFLTG